MTLAAAPPLSNERIAAIVARLDRPIVLVGLMGVGKSTVGRRLAALIGSGFADADAEIEKAADRTISEIFDAHGEAYFRDGERRVIARLLDEDHGVIATGGGAFVDPETRSMILDKAIAVWLDCDIDTLVERTARRNHRPLLRDGDPREILRQLRDKRIEAYSQAHCHVLTDHVPHHTTVRRILEAIEQCL